MSSDVQPSYEEVRAVVEAAFPPYYTLIGEIAAIWAMFEQKLDELIWDLADVEQSLGACLTSQLNGPAPRFRVLKTLLELRGWPTPIQTEVNKFSHSIQTFQEERNRAVHDVLLVGHESGIVYRRSIATINNKLKFDMEEHSLSDLKTVVDESLKLLRTFDGIQDKIRACAPTPSPDKLSRLRRRQGPPSATRLPLDLTSRDLHDQPSPSPE